MRTCSQKRLLGGDIAPPNIEKWRYSMKQYIECRHSECDKILVTFWRTRYDGMTIYKSSVMPCRVETIDGRTWETFVPQNGYQYNLNAVKRASRKAEDSARVEMQWFIHRALDLLSDNGFEPAMCGKDLADRVIYIVKSIDCEVR